jgi:hypothetical protein
MRHTSLGIGLGTLCFAAAIGLARLHAGMSADVLRAMSEGEVNPALIARLRAAGPPALDELFKQRLMLDSAKDEERDPARLPKLNERLVRLDEIIDQVGMQRYCSRSRLFWYTNFEQAKAAATASGKPILSLRLLGKLNEDFSCANSRFFRTTLYANEEIANLLRDKFVLHWQSVRPVPKVTIDFGDGRKLERTLTGNSVHYILTPAGDVVDALPGLYGPKAFLEQITEGLSLAQRVSSVPAAERTQLLASSHLAKLEKLDRDWMGDLGRAEIIQVQSVEAETNAGQTPAANAAAAIARPKVAVEAPLIRSALPLATDPTKLEDENLWQAIAALHADDAILDAASRDLIQSQNPTAAQAAPIAITKMIVESPLVRMVRTLESSIAVDTVKNEYRLHREIHRWLSEGSAPSDVNSLNERVYAELFLTPNSDPWLGLAPADVYTALPSAGVVRK